MTSYSLTWKVSDRHILGMKADQRESILLDLKPPQRCIGGSGLNLKQENFLVSMPHRFRQNCSDLDREELKTSCNPLSAANVRVKQMTNDKKDPYIINAKLFQGTLVVMSCGNGHYISESPFKVHVKPCGDATKGAMVSNSNFQ